MKKMYCLVVTDAYSRFTWVLFLASKDETSGILKSFITGIENLVDHKVKVIRCDNGTEFKNREMNQFCEMKGILRQFSVAITPQHNGVIERRNRTLIEAARTMLADFKTPSLSFMRPFGCPIIILNTIDYLGKFNGKADKGFFVGYSLNSKAFRVFNSRTRIVEENLHIRFSESTPNVVGSRPDWLFDIDALTRIMNYEPIVAGTQSNGFVDPKSSHDDGSKPSSDDEKKVDEDPRKDSKIRHMESMVNPAQLMRKFQPVGNFPNFGLHLERSDISRVQLTPLTKSYNLFSRYEVADTSVRGTVAGGGWTNKKVTRGTGVCQYE
ncbi:retrovirus-related pol polyprotein from transposon TNT 1-94, partial [Tanacetum coccineum]